MRVKFVKKCTYQQVNAKDSRVYEEGQEYDLADDHANRWIRRGAAVKVEKKVEPKPIKVEAPVIETPKGEAKSK